MMSKESTVRILFGKYYIIDLLYTCSGRLRQEQMLDIYPVIEVKLTWIEYLYLSMAVGRWRWQYIGSARASSEKCNILAMGGEKIHKQWHDNLHS